MADQEFNDRENPKHLLEARIVAALEDRSSDLDPAVRRRLDRIRAAALDAASDRQPGNAWFGSRWKPLAAGLAAASVALAVAAVLVDPSPQTEPPPRTADLDVLTDPRFELFVEDPEFVAWIAEAEPEAASTENSG